jgi:hypothetical protein
MFPFTISKVVAAEPTKVIGCKKANPGKTMCLSGSWIVLNGGADLIFKYIWDEISFKFTSSLAVF